MEKDLKIFGYASLFNAEDLSGDIIKKGAFKSSLENRGSVPLLFNHDTCCPIGVWERVEEDEHGLFVSGIIKTSVSPNASRVASLVFDNIVSEISIGYRIVEASQRPEGGQNLIELSLEEISLRSNRGDKIKWDLL